MHPERAAPEVLVLVQLVLAPVLLVLSQVLEPETLAQVWMLVLRVALALALGPRQVLVLRSKWLRSQAVL